MPSKKSSPPEPIVLDTHVLVWFFDGSARVDKKVAARIVAAADANELYVAAMTPWEIAMAARLGRIRTRGSILAYIQAALAAVRAAVAPIEPAIAVDAVDLPGWDHGDPSDRIIVATARHLGAVLVTADTEILDYAANVKAVRVLEPS